MSEEESQGDQSDDERLAGCTCESRCRSDCKGECGCEVCHDAYMDFLTFRD